MSYTFDILGVAPVLEFFYYQQKVEQNPNRSKAYLSSYECTLDSFIEAIEIIPKKPDWNWDDVVNSIIQFWLKHENKIQQWKLDLDNSTQDKLVVARVANINLLKNELENLL